MTIKTKYNIGDEVWFLEDSKAKSGKVTGLRFSYGIGEYFGEVITHVGQTYVNYFLRGDFIHSGCIFEEKFLFPTKEELLNSL